MLEQGDTGDRIDYPASWRYSSIGFGMMLRRVKLDRPRPHHLLWLAVAAALLCYLFYQHSAGGSSFTPHPVLIGYNFTPTDMTLAVLGNRNAGTVLHVPSPGTLGLMGLGLLAMIPWGRRRGR